MSNAITAHTINNGVRNLILQFNIVADGSGDYSDFELLNVLDYLGSGHRDVPNDFKVLGLSGRNGVGTSLQLKFGSAANNHRLFFESVADESFHESWSGGLTTGVTDADMTVRITTLGFDASADTITLQIHLQKKFSRNAA